MQSVRMQSTLIQWVRRTGTERDAMPAADHHDGTGNEFRAQAGGVLDAAGHAEDVIAEFGQHLPRCVVTRSTLHQRPADRLAMGVDDQDLR